MRAPPLALLRVPLLALPLVAGCASLASMLPGGPVLTPSELAAWPAPRPAAVAYTGPARAGVPVVPLQVFGVHYDVDVVLVSRHPSWDMHEYARIQTPQGPVWLAKDADRDKVQTIVAEIPDLESRIAEVPVPRQATRLRVADRSEGRRIDVALSYTNPEGEPVTVTYRGKMPRKPPGKRNGNTMGHSAHAVAVVLDLARMGLGGRARIEIDGEHVPLDRLLGMRQRYLLEQAQGGVAVASFTQVPADGGGFTLARPAPGATDPATGQPGWPTHRTEAWVVDGDTAWFDDGWTRQVYRFADGGMAGATVHQAGRDGPVFSLVLDPALPDLTRPFTGVASSRFRMDVDGQEGHGTGTVTAWWDGEHAVVDLTPTAPAWLVDRPLRTTISYDGFGAATVQTVRR